MKRKTKRKGDVEENTSGFNIDDEVVIMKSDEIALLLYKKGRIIGFSNNDEIIGSPCIEFDFCFIGGNNGNSLRFEGKSFQCLYFPTTNIKPFTKEVVEEVRIIKELMMQKELDSWFGEGEKY